MTLSDTDRAVLELERSWFKYAGNKESVIWERFGISSTRYYAALNAIIDMPDALAEDPMTVRRLRRMRAARHVQRSARRLGFDLVE